MPRGRKPSQINKPKINEMTCAACSKIKKVSNFYVSYNPLHTTGRIPYCKACLKDIVYENGNFSIEGVKKALKLIDRPYLYDLIKSSAAEEGETFGLYIKNLQMQQYRHLGWKDSIFEPESDNENNTPQINNFEIAKLSEKWGDGYKFEEYIAFEKKYDLLKNNYTQKTAMHTEALLNYIRYRVKEEMATARGDVKEAKEWGSLAKDAATAAKINPSQLSKADLSDGLSTFSELSQAVEKEVDIIPILPKFKYRPNDALDFNIWCYINYIRDLSGLSLCKYEDVYAFYDKRKQEYIEQYGDPYGIFNEDPSEKNRDKIKKFIHVNDGDD